MSSGAGSLQLLEELENCRKTNSPGKPEDSSKQGDYGQESGKLNYVYHGQFYIFEKVIIR